MKHAVVVFFAADDKMLCLKYTGLSAVLLPCLGSQSYGRQSVHIVSGFIFFIFTIGLFTFGQPTI